MAFSGAMKESASFLLLLLLLFLFFFFVITSIAVRSRLLFTLVSQFDSQTSWMAWQRKRHWRWDVSVSRSRIWDPTCGAEKAKSSNLWRVNGVLIRLVWLKNLQTRLAICNLQRTKNRKEHVNFSSYSYQFINLQYPFTYKWLYRS